MNLGKNVLITGITGQDGSYLAEYLLSKGYIVYGMIRRTSVDSNNRLWRLQNIINNPNFKLIPGSLENYASVCEVIIKTNPSKCFHLGAQSFVQESFHDKSTTFLTNINGTLYILQAIHTFAPKCAVYFAASSEMFGAVIETPQNEYTAFNPRSPYGISKCTGYYLTKNFRESYGLTCCSGILFNHESPRRGEEFVTRKITLGLAKVKLGLQDYITLGNLDAKRDWGYAADYVKYMNSILDYNIEQKQNNKNYIGDDFIIATGTCYSVRDFTKIVCENLNLNFNDVVKIDQQYIRPAEVVTLCGNMDKAKSLLSLDKPTFDNFEKFVKYLSDADLKYVMSQTHK